MPPSQATPACLSIILCDHAQLDSATSKVTLFGCFENIVAAGFPANIPQMTLFAELTDGRGETPIALKIVRSTPEALEGDVLFSSEVGSVNFADPRMVIRLNWTLGQAVFQQPGEYRYILETQGRFIAERRLVALARG